MSSPRKSGNFSPASFKPRGSINKSTDKRDSKLLANNVRRPTKLDYNVDLMHLKPIPIKESKIELSKESKKIIKINKLGSSRKVTSNLKPLESQLAVELEDPANELLRNDIQRIMQMVTEVNSLDNDYNTINEVKNEIKTEINEIMEKHSNLQISKSKTSCKFTI